MTAEEMADEGAALDAFAARDGWGDRFVGGADAALVLDGDQRTVHDHAGEHHGSR